MSIQDTSNSGLALAVRKAGSQVAFGKLIGRRQSTIRGWLLAGKDLPAELVFQVEEALDISRHDLRPDLYPREEDTSPARHSAEQPPAPQSHPAASCPDASAGAGGPSSGEQPSEPDLAA